MDIWLVALDPSLQRPSLQEAITLVLIGSNTMCMATASVLEKESPRLFAESCRLKRFKILGSADHSAVLYLGRGLSENRFPETETHFQNVDEQDAERQSHAAVIYNV